MRISRPQFRSPVLCIDDFLEEAEAQSILRECIDLKRVYMPATVFDGPTAVKVDKNHRDNEVVYLDEVYRSEPGRSDILTIIRNKIWTDECRELWHEGDYIFDIINYSTWHEAVVSRYGTGNFYGKHQDTRMDHITYRLVTLIIYVNTVPAQFSGGALTLWKENESLKIEPQHNRAVVFPSFLLHEVAPVTMNTAKWEDGRFSINYWLGFR